jgi:hypothetical protein
MTTTTKRKKIKDYTDEADDQIVNIIYAMLKADSEYDWWDNIPASVKKSIIKAEKELDEGKGVPHEVVMKQYAKYFNHRV